MRIHDAAPDFQTRELIALVWAQPVLTPAQLALAQWISEQYLAPLIESLRLMMPAGLSQRGRTVFVRTSTLAPSGLSEKQSALLARIAQKPGDWSELTQDVKRATQRDDLEPLIAMHLVTREAEFPSPPPRPKTDRQVRLLVDADEVKRVLPTLGRASKQADVLGWLAIHGSSPVPLPDLLTAVPCERSAVKALAERGWVTLTQARRRAEPAIVELNLRGEALAGAFEELRSHQKHRAVLELLLSQPDPMWIGRIYAETEATRDTLRDLEAAGLISVAEEMVWRDPLAGHDFTLDTAPTLTADQERVWNAIREDQDGCFLLHGVTGSGKTEIYLRAIALALSQGKQAVVLVPEIALTPQTIRRFVARFPGRVTVWHSELGEGERFDVWRRVRNGHPAAQVVVGSRSALFLPYGDLGVIVVDEEHEPSYKQERTPRYHARSVAIRLAQECSARSSLAAPRRPSRLSMQPSVGRR